MSPKRKLRLSKKPKASVVHGPKPFKRRPNHPQWVVDVFRSWRAAHPNSILYRDDKEALAARTGLSVEQVEYWFRNQRRRGAADVPSDASLLLDACSPVTSTLHDDCISAVDNASLLLDACGPVTSTLHDDCISAVDDASLSLDTCGPVTWTLYDDCIGAVDNSPLLLDAGGLVPWTPYDGCISAVGIDAGGLVPWTLCDDCISAVDKRLYDDSFVIIPPTAHA